MLTIVVAVSGKYIWVESELAKTINHLCKFDSSDFEILAVLDGKKWLSAPIVRTLSSRSKNIKILISETSNENFATLWNLGLENMSSEQAIFIWPGCLPDLHQIRNNINPFSDSIISFLDYDSISQFKVTLDTISSQLRHILQCHNLLNICNVIFPRKIFRLVGGFNDSPLLFEDCAHEFFLRCIEHNISIELREGSVCQSRWELKHFPKMNFSPIPTHVSHSFSIKVSQQPSTDDEFLGKFCADLPNPEKQLTLREIKRAFQEPVNIRPYKIAVISGVYDYVHSQLCFYNYFDLLFGSGAFFYTPFLDVAVQPERDLQAFDCVIISRGREDNLYQVLDYCKKQHIPSIYMIDDNWFWVGRDWEKHYGKLFALESPSYKVFSMCLQECDAVLVYNKILAEDVSPYAKSVIQIPVNIDPKLFSAKITRPELAQTAAQLLDWRQKETGLIMGYVGSLRYTNTAFEALAEASMLTKSKIKVLLFGHFLPEQLDIFKNADTVIVPYTSYQNYAAFLGEVKPDLLLAPLDETRSSMSKAPNKYLEYSMTESAGIYSRIFPYTDVIEPGVNGFLVDNNKEAWKRAILELADHPARMKKMATTANQDVMKKFSTESVSSIFVDMLKTVIQRTNK